MGVTRRMEGILFYESRIELDKAYSSLCGKYDVLLSTQDKLLLVYDTNVNILEENFETALNLATHGRIVGYTEENSGSQKLH